MHTPGGGGGGDHGSCELGEGGPEGSRRLFFCSNAAARNSELAEDMPTCVTFCQLGTKKEKLRQATLELGVYLHVSFREALARSDVWFPQSFPASVLPRGARSSRSASAP